MEKLGGGQNHGAHDGPRRGGGQRGGEEAEEEAAAGLPLRQPQESQLVGIIFFILFCSLLNFSQQISFSIVSLLIYFPVCRWAYRYFFCELLALLNVIGGARNNTQSRM